VPTELERPGDFSQSVDNNNRPYNLIRDYTTGLPCTASNTSGCFRTAASSAAFRPAGCMGRLGSRRPSAPNVP
jgi:hypothetical protein